MTHMPRRPVRLAFGAALLGLALVIPAQAARPRPAGVRSAPQASTAAIDTVAAPLS